MAGAAATTATDEYRSQVDETKQEEFDRVNKLFEENFKNDDPSESVDQVWKEFQNAVKQAGKVGLSEQEMDALFAKMKPRYEQAVKYEKEAPHTKNTAERHYKEDTVKNFKASTKAASTDILENVKYVGRKVNEKFSSFASEHKIDADTAFKKAKPWLLGAMIFFGNRVMAIVAIAILVHDLHQKLTEKRLQEELQAQKEEQEKSAKEEGAEEKSEEDAEREPKTTEASQDVPQDEESYPFRDGGNEAEQTATLDATQKENERLRKELEETKQKLAASQKRVKDLEAQIDQEVKDVNSQEMPQEIPTERVNVKEELKNEKDKAAAAEFAQRTDLYDKGMQVFEENSRPGKLLIVPMKNNEAPVFGIPKGSETFPDYKGKVLDSLKAAKADGKTELSTAITDVRYPALAVGTPIDKAIEEVEKRAVDQKTNEEKKVPNNGKDLYFIGGTKVSRKEAAQHLAKNAKLKDFDIALNDATREGIILRNIRDVGAKLKENESLIGTYHDENGEKRQYTMLSKDAKTPDYQAIHKQLQQLQKQGVKKLDHDIKDPKLPTIPKGTPIKTAIQETGNRAEIDRQNKLKEKNDPDVRDDSSKIYDEKGNRVGDETVAGALSSDETEGSDKDSFIRKLSTWKEEHQIQYSVATKGYRAAKQVITKVMGSAERAAAAGASRI